MNILRHFSTALPRAPAANSKITMYAAAFLVGGASYAAYYYTNIKTPNTKPKFKALDGEFVEFKVHPTPSPYTEKTGTDSKHSSNQSPK